MKLALNGALTIGTLDGANIEIMEEVGEDNIFIFGLTTEAVNQLRHSGYQPQDYYHRNAALKQVLDMIGSGFFSPEEPSRYKPIINNLIRYGDHYMLMADYADYVARQDEVAVLYQDQEAWSRKAILNTANMGKFSSDRTIRDYARQIWNTEPVKINLPAG